MYNWLIDFQNRHEPNVNINCWKRDRRITPRRDTYLRQKPPFWRLQSLGHQHASKWYSRVDPSNLYAKNTMACKSSYTPQLQTFSPVEKMVWLGRLYPFVVGLFRPITSGANCLLLVFSPGALQKQQRTRSVPVADCYHFGETPPPRKRSTWRSIFPLYFKEQIRTTPKHFCKYELFWN